MKMELTLKDLDIEVEVIAGTKERYSSSYGNWLPGDAPEVRLKKVVLWSEDGKQSVDILPYLTSERISEIEDIALNEAYKQEVI